MKQLRLLVLCGGKSAEHSISLVSTWNLLNTLDAKQFDVTLIAIDKEGNWFLQDADDFLQQEPSPKTITIKDTTRPVLVKPGNTDEIFYNLKTNQFLKPIDVVYALLHGPNGEDGSMQGCLKQLQIPYIGSGVLGSAICMDKGVAKQLLQQNNIPTSQFLSFYKGDLVEYDSVVGKLGLPLFVKPANMGSSVGISKVENKDEFNAAIEEAFTFDTKIVIEEFVDGIEVECAILGNEQLEVSRPGTYVHSDEFFDFDTKYLKGNEVKMQIPAQALNEEQMAEVMELSKKAFTVLHCTGYARVDTFFTKNGDFLVNEINTIPGFTQNSMYPVLMENSGYTYNELVKRMCLLAIEKFSK